MTGDQNVRMDSIFKKNSHKITGVSHGADSKCAGKFRPRRVQRCAKRTNQTLLGGHRRPQVDMSPLRVGSQTFELRSKFPSGPDFHGQLKPPLSSQKRRICTFRTPFDASRSKLSSALRISDVRHNGELLETFFENRVQMEIFDLNSNGRDWTIWGFKGISEPLISFPKCRFALFTLN